MTRRPDIAPFPDAEDVWVRYIAAKLEEPDTRVSTETQPDARFVKIVRVGGVARSMFTDEPTIAFECYDTYADDAMALTQRVRAIVSNARGRQLVDGIVCKGYTEFSGPANLPDPNHESTRYSWTAATALHPTGTEN